MHILIYGHRARQKDIPVVISLLEKLQAVNITFSIFSGFARQLIKLGMNQVESYDQWSDHDELRAQKADCMITLGGDGTILTAITHVKDSQLPILGINLGRLGFLASTEKNKITEALEQLREGDYAIENRTMLHLESSPKIFIDTNFALNDFTLHKRDTSSMIIIHAYVNGDFLNSYWADGIIVSTPTGSTGYSLSCGGPIVFPKSGNLIITPVAPHNLNVRPIVISDKSVITFEIEGRSANFLCTLDSRSETITTKHQLAVRKNDFSARMIRPHGTTFLQTIHEKLSWGIDHRN
ncbi:MAG: NAD kinase [Saprospiraceae bacterium]|nr:NAD kinase [Saprospiraceae bacterium]